MDEDKFGELLRGEIPVPDSGYWGDVEDRLSHIANEQGKTQDRNEVFDASETNPGLVRLKSMDQLTTVRNNRSPWILGAAAAVLLVGGVAFAATRTGDSPVEIATAPGDEGAVEFLSDEAPGEWRVVQGVAAPGRLSPGDDDAVNGNFYDSGDGPLPSTGRRAQAGGLEWKEFTGADGNTFWLAATEVQPFSD